MNINVRRAESRDAETLTALARAAKAHWGYPDAWMQAWAEDLELRPEYLASHRAYVAEVRGVVGGVAVLEDRGDHWQIEHVWVDPAQHGHGIGKVLVNQCVKVARETRDTEIRVLSDPYAKDFYVRLGARQITDVAAPMPGAPDRKLPLLVFAPSDKDSAMSR